MTEGMGKFFADARVFSNGVMEEPFTVALTRKGLCSRLNVKRASKNPENEHKASDEREALSRAVTLDILSILKDDKGRGFYLNVARRVPSQVIYRLLAEIRADIINNPHTRVQNPAAIFTKRIKEVAAERGIEL